MMMKIIVFGTGSSAENFLSQLDQSGVEILCFADNNPSKQSKIFMGKRIINPGEIMGMSYDYIIIASQYSMEIMEQLLAMGVEYKKIIPFDYLRHNRLNEAYYQETLNHMLIRHKIKSNKKMRIALINYNYANYHGYALYKYMPDFIKAKYDVELLAKEDKEYLKTFDVICSSHFDGIYDGYHVNFEFWHAFPLKQMGVRHQSVAEAGAVAYYNQRTKNTNLIMSSSELFTTFFNACYPTTVDKYRITGMPRNDLLFEGDSLRKLERLCNKPLSGYNVFFYLPTWRKGKKSQRMESNKQWDDALFGFPGETGEDVIKFLEKTNGFLVVKLHPYEYNSYKEMKIFRNERVFLLSDETLTENEIHLYEILASAKILITDYSSVFFDTLLIDIPVLFAPMDLSEYRESRGFLLEPYTYLTPGPTVFTLEDLEKESLKYLHHEDTWKNQRELVKNLVFRHFDNNSSLRVWQEIDKYLGFPEKVLIDGKIGHKTVH